eukprot:GCRY01002338.1.p1 GENE.GCRY01002338.1~~GCRY01002338.1.p1  ORF type:complete len:477 (+),score=-7.24 GCRY01002338.1:282-1712(+)
MFTCAVYKLIMNAYPRTLTPSFSHNELPNSKGLSFSYHLRGHIRKVHHHAFSFFFRSVYTPVNALDKEFPYPKAPIARWLSENCRCLDNPRTPIYKSSSGFPSKHSSQPQVKPDSSGCRLFDNIWGLRFHPKVALALACLTAASYESDAATVGSVGFLHDILCDWGFNGREIRYFPLTGRTFAFIAPTQDCVVLCFRGTSPFSWRDNIRDQRTAFVPFGPPGSGMLIHQGFYSALTGFQMTARGELRPAWELLYEALQEHHGKRVFICGHSLGGSLAAVLAALFCVEGIDSIIAGIFTFGQPNIGNRALSNFLKLHLSTRFFRFVNQNDIVPRLPLRSSFFVPGIKFFSWFLNLWFDRRDTRRFGFNYDTRVGTCVYIDSCNGLTELPDLAEQHSWQDMLKSFVARPFTLFQDFFSTLYQENWALILAKVLLPSCCYHHFPVEYIRGIAAFIEAREGLALSASRPQKPQEGQRLKR